MKKNLKNYQNEKFYKSLCIYVCGINFIFIIMQLEERFDKLIPIEFGGEMQEPLCSKCVEIAENFAIGFVRWCLKEENNIYFETKELLEIYKKTL